MVAVDRHMRLGWGLFLLFPFPKNEGWTEEEGAKEEVKIYSQLRAAFVRVVWVVFGLIFCFAVMGNPTWYRQKDKLISNFTPSRFFTFQRPTGYVKTLRFDRTGLRVYLDSFAPMQNVKLHGQEVCKTRSSASQVVWVHFRNDTIERRRKGRSLFGALPDMMHPPQLRRENQRALLQLSNYLHHHSFHSSLSFRK